MSKITQKDAVFNAISSVLAEAGVSVPEGQSYSEHMTRERRAQVTNILVEGFNTNTVELDKTFSEADLRAYASGLQSNWLRKDSRLNGGTKYVAKNPGSRVGAGDAQLKALRALLSSKTDADERSEIQSFIDARVTEIGASKKKTVTVDFSVLPAALAAKYST
jgi:hypothetical protein